MLFQAAFLFLRIGVDIMAMRPAWSVSDNSVVCRWFEFVWNAGFAVTQKQKNILNLHASIKKETNETALEVSSKGLVSIGRNIGAFSLKYNDVPLENVFQSSKKFKNGGPYRDLLSVTPKEAKRDERIRNSGKIVSFCLGEEEWPIEPQTAFYDYIYVKALVQSYGMALNLAEYSWFTDIEFNPNRSINCQARSAAVYRLLQMMDAFEVIETKDKWIEFHRKFVKG